MNNAGVCGFAMRFVDKYDPWRFVKGEYEVLGVPDT
jgi:hypothetical protein